VFRREQDRPGTGANAPYTASNQVGGHAFTRGAVGDREQGTAGFTGGIGQLCPGCVGAGLGALSRRVGPLGGGNLGGSGGRLEVSNRGNALLRGLGSYVRSALRFEFSVRWLRVSWFRQSPSR